jgi:uncharacterized coiled-coil DUF342 family protein
MTMPVLILRHLCFTGPEKPPALIVFERGLNVIHGASDTGKSFILEAIDFMLGGHTPLRDIPERVGYDRLLLGIETENDSYHTLVRAANGGQFQLFEGLHQSLPEGMEGVVLNARHSADNPKTVSTFLLNKIGFASKRIRTNKQGDTRSLSFRDLCRLCLVNEGDIQKQGSPLESGQVTFKTPEYATFKLLLSGVDDKALVAITKDSSASQSSTAKLEFLDEILADYRDKLMDMDEQPEELAAQLERLEASINNEQQALSVSEQEYQQLVNQRSNLRRRFQNGADRRSEITELLARFELLDEHYLSDLARLEGIQEAGSLVAALTSQTCPLCGAHPNQQHQDKECDGNLEVVVTAAEAEAMKIKRLRRELQETVHQLGREAQSFDRLMPKMREDISILEDKIQALGPGLVEHRSSYSELVDKRASVRSALSLWDQIVDLQTRREDLENASKSETSSPQGTTDLSSTTVDQFAQQVACLLKSWNFPDAERVHFEESTRDLVIAGKRRGSRGKGMRAITHAAFTIGLLEFCKAQNQPHPGFVILDSPLLAYREPEGTEDDLRGTDVRDRFYEYLAGCTDRQVVIIENIDPPVSVAERPTSTMFSKNPHQGRYGFFPLPPSSGANIHEL